MTAPEPEAVLLSFYRKVRPHVTGWTAMARLAPEIAPTRDLGRNLLCWILGCAMVYAALFGGGWLILGPRGKGILFLAIAIACGWILYALISRQTFARMSESGSNGSPAAWGRK